MSATRSSAPGAGELLGARDVYRRFLAASDAIAAATLPSLSQGWEGRGSVADGLAPSWAHDAIAVILDRVGAALLAGDVTVLLDHLSVELSELRRTGIPEVHLIGLLDSVTAALPADLAPALHVVAEGRAHLLRAGARPVRAVSPPSPTRPVAASGLPGQAFTDLLLLGALACQAPVALLSVPQPDGSWSTLQHGLDTKQGRNDGQLFHIVATDTQPVEIPDLIGRLPWSPLVLPPHSMRWAYGTALRRDAGTLIGVVVLLDRWLREATKREQRALVSLARQLGAHLVEWIGPAGADPVRPIGAVGRAAHPSGSGALAASGGHRSVQGDASGATAKGAGAAVTTRHNLLRSQEVAEIFDVTERTVINWAAAGKLPSLRTIGGHLRFRREDVLRLLAPAD